MKLAAPLFLLLIALPASASPWRKVDGFKGFGGMRAEIQHRIDADPDNKATINHVCVVVDAGNPTGVGPIAWVHLRERQYLLGFTSTRLPPIDDASLAGGGSIDLAHDVVATPADIDGSTFKRTRADVDRIINACRAHGDSFVLVKQHG